MIFTAKLVQMSAMCKKKTDFLFAYSRVQPNLSKISATWVKSKIKTQVFDYAYVMEPYNTQDSIIGTAIQELSSNAMIQVRV